MRLPLILTSWHLNLPSALAGRSLRTSVTAAACALVTMAAPAFAADEPAPAPTPEAPPAAQPAAAPEAKPADAKPPEAIPEIGGSAESAYGITDDAVPAGSRLDWAARREIRVIQKRAILKEGRHGLSFSAGVVPNDDFFAYVTLGLGYQYYFSEDLALRIRTMYTADTKTSLQDSLQAKVPLGPQVIVRLPQTLTGFALAGVDWNLLHGKLGFFTTRLIEFDLSLNFGVGAVVTAIRDKGREDSPIFAPAPAGNVGATMQIYITDRLALGFDYTQLFYPKMFDLFSGASHENITGVSHPLATTLTLTWFTAGLQ